MAQIVTIKMSKFDNQPWGFRIQGGIDFAAPLAVQKVNGGGLAEKAGLRVGDALLRVNGMDIYQLRHKDAQDAVSRAGNNFELVVSRGGGLPRTGGNKQADPLPQPQQQQQPIAPVAPVQQNKMLGKSMLNFTAKPFVPFGITTTKEEIITPMKEEDNNNYLIEAPKDPFTPEEKKRAKEMLSTRLAQMRVQPSPGRTPPPTAPRTSAPSSPSLINITPSSKPDGGNVKLVNRQFNSPMGLYSEENIAETLSSQAEVLAQGVLGVNFKKNEKLYDPGNSEVFKMLQEMEKAPREPEPGIDIDPADASPAQKGLGANPSTIQSRAFQRIQQLTSPSPTSVLKVENSSSVLMSPTAERSVHFAPQMATPPAVKNFTSFPANNIGSTPPVGGVRIFPAGPAPSGSPYQGMKPFSPVQQQVKPLAAPSGIKPVSFTPAAHRPLGNNGFGAGAAGSSPKGSASGLSAPRRGRGVLNNVSVGPGARVPVCASCSSQIRGKFVTALGLTWCPNHFLCATPQCRRELHEVGFVEEQKKLYCEGCFEAYLAPTCARCSKRVKGDCLNAIGKQFHPECFACTYCGRLFGNSHFYLEDGLPYCEADWNELFTTKCYACGFPIEAGDRWVEAMNNNYHSQCFTCSVCKKNLEGQSFLGKGGKPMCKSHAR